MSATTGNAGEQTAVRLATKERSRVNPAWEGRGQNIEGGI